MSFGNQWNRSNKLLIGLILTTFIYLECILTLLIDLKDLF